MALQSAACILTALYLLSPSVEAGRMSFSQVLETDDESVRNKVLDELAKEKICGSTTIPSALSEGESVDSIRGIQWNAIMKTATKFMEHRQQDIDRLSAEVEALEAEVLKTISKRDAFQVPHLAEQEIQELVGDAVRKGFGGVQVAREKLCWDGGMDAMERSDNEFASILVNKMETSQTNVQAVQDACMKLMVTEVHDVNMCDELCNSLGKSAARVSAASDRVKSFVNLEDRISRLRTDIKSKQESARSIEEEKRECEEDQEILTQHKDELGVLNRVIHKEKIGIFMARHTLGTAKGELSSLTEDNGKLSDKTQELDGLAGEAKKNAAGVRDALDKLRDEELQLNKDMQKQAEHVEALSGKVRRAGDAAETVIEFKAQLQRMLLVWIEYYKKSIVEPMSRMEHAFPNESFPEIVALKSQASKAASDISAFCAADTTKAALSSVDSLPELSMICDKRLTNSKDLVRSLSNHVGKRQSEEKEFIKELAANVSKVEKKYAYRGPKLTGVRGEIEGVWTMRAFFYKDPFYRKYLKGWKAVSQRMVDALRARGWKGKVDDLFDGRWVRLCEKLDGAFTDAEAEYAKEKENLKKIINEFEDIMAQVEEVKKQLAAAEKAHQIATDKAQASQKKLEEMLQLQEVMEGKVKDLQKKAEESLESLRAAEKEYRSTHQEAIS